MHFAKCGSEAMAVSRAAEGTRSSVFVPRVRSAGVDERIPTDPDDLQRRLLEERLRDPELRAEYERLYAEMFQQFAPATEGPIVNPGRRRRGRLIFGDDVGETRAG
jgi:hypothetical protein